MLVNVISYRHWHHGKLRQDVLTKQSVTVHYTAEGIRIAGDSMWRES